MKVGYPRCLGYPGLVGFPASPYILCCLSGCVHMRGGVPHSAGQPVSSGWVARLSGVDFFHVNTIPRGTGVRFIRAFDNLARQKQAGKQNGVHSLSTW